MRPTHSLCPVCLKRIPAEYTTKNGDVYLEKRCPEHGRFETVVWRGDLNGWLGLNGWHSDPEDNCPHECGLCAGHEQGTCCIEVELTSRCNLRCPYCLENGVAREPSLQELSGLFREFVSKDMTFVHLTGGEPTVREDLPEIVRAAAKAGCKYIQLNSNGVRLAEDKALVKKLAEAGLSFVFLQFDGTDDAIYSKTRGRPLLDIKKRAIENCAKYNLGVSLVPTLVPGVNTDNIGGIIDFAVKNSPAVRGVHFQPVSYFGRYPKAPSNDDRYTLPELIAAIEKQAGIKPDCFRYSTCDHPMCGFHGDFVVMPTGLRSLTRDQPPRTAEPPRSGGSCCCGASKSPPVTAESVRRNREFVGRRWLRGVGVKSNCPPDSLEGFASRLRTHGFTITAMAFQDAYNADTNRLRHCSLHIWSEGKIMPFCLRYILR